MRERGRISFPVTRRVSIKFDIAGQNLFPNQERATSKLEPEACIGNASRLNVRFLSRFVLRHLLCVSLCVSFHRPRDPPLMLTSLPDRASKVPTAPPLVFTTLPLWASKSSPTVPPLMLATKILQFLIGKMLVGAVVSSRLDKFMPVLSSIFE